MLDKKSSTRGGKRIANKQKKYTCDTTSKQTLREAAFLHPHPKVQRRCLAVLILSFVFCPVLVGAILGLTPQSVRSFWRIYKQEGILALQKLHYKGSKNALNGHAKSIEENFELNPPHSIKEAAARIAQITGIKRGLKSVRMFLRGLKFSYRKVSGIPAKADKEKQKSFLETILSPCLEEAKKGLRTVLFADASHFVHSLFLGCVWSKKRVFIKSPSGRMRFNVLGAVNAITKKIHTVCNETFVNAETVCELLRLIAKTYPNQLITLVLDNAKYQRCSLVTTCAASLNIELLFLPPYSPNLNLIERVWKLVKKKALNAKYYETFQEFKKAITDTLRECDDKLAEELRTLLALEFQLFSEEEVKVA